MYWLARMDIKFDGLTKRRTKLRKFLLLTLLSFLLLSGMLAVLTRNQIIQNYLAQKVATYLSKEFKTKVSVGYVSIDFLRTFHIENLQLQDLQKDTLVSWGVMEARLGDFYWSRKKIKLDYVSLVNFQMKIGQYTRGGDLNHQFLLDYFASTDTTTSTSKPFSVDILKLNLKDSRFVYFYQQKKSNYVEFDPNYIDFQQINVELDSVYIDQKSLLRGKINHIALKEISGLMITKGVADLDITNDYIDLNNMTFYTKESVLGKRVKLMFQSWRDFNEVESKVKWLFDLQKSKIQLEELVAFHPWFKDRRAEFYVTGKAQGTLGHLTSQDVWIQGVETQTWLHGALDLKSLVNLNEFSYRYQLNPSIADMRDVRDVVVELDSVGRVDYLGNVSLSGTVGGTLNTADYSGSIANNVAAYDGDLNFDFTRGIDSLNYTILGGLSQFQLQELGQDLSHFWIERGELDISGVGYDPESMKLSAVLMLHRYGMQQRKNANLALRLDIAKNQLEYEVESKDNRFDANAVGIIEEFATNPHVRGSATVNQLVLDNIGLDSLPMQCRAVVDFDWLGSDLQHSTFYFTLDDAVFDYDGSRYFCRTQELQHNEQVGWVFQGDWLQGNITKGFDLNETESLINTLLHNYFPQDFERPLAMAKQDFEFNLQLIQTRWIPIFFQKNLDLGLVNLIGSVNTSEQKVDLELGPLDVRYNGLNSDQMRVSLHTQAGEQGILKVRMGRMQAGKTVYDQFEVFGRLDQGKIDLKMAVHDQKDRYQFNLNTSSENNKEDLITNFATSQIRVFNQPWVVDKQAQVTYKKGKKWDINQFMLADKDHYIEVKGVLSKSLKDTLHVEFANVTPEILSPFFPEKTFDSLLFNATADFDVAAALGDRVFIGNCGLNNIKYYGYNFGSLDVELRDAGKEGLLGLAARGRKGPIKGLALLGSVDLLNQGHYVDMYMDIPNRTTAMVLQPFLAGAVTIQKGFLGGVVNIQGEIEDLKIDGEIDAKDIELGVDYLKTVYVFSATFDVNSQGVFSKKSIQLMGKEGKSSAFGTLAFTYPNFQNMGLDIQISDAKNLRVLETTEKDNSLFYGSARASGNCRIYGPLDKINIKAELTPEKNSKVSILYPTMSENTLYSDIVFRNHFGEVVKKDSVVEAANDDDESSVLGNIEIVVHANENLETEFVIDRKLGDVISGRGDGDIRMLYDEEERFFLYGKYRVSAGEYQFSLPGINLTKKMVLDNGGWISWTGDPYNANVSLTGKIEKRISPAQLMTTMGGGSTNYPPTLIVSMLQLTGNLMRPNIAFDISAPELMTSGGSNSEVNGVIQRIRQDKDETMRQSVALLLFGNFLPPSFSNANPGAANVLSGAGVAGNSVSNIASNVINDLFSKAGVPTRIQVNYDDVRTKNGSSNGQVFVNSEWFLTDRLRLDVNFDPTVSMVGLAMPLNFNLEYKTSNENWRVRAFSRSSNMLLQQSGTTTNGVSGNTLGTGLVYRRQFNSFRRKSKDSSELVSPRIQ